MVERLGEAIQRLLIKLVGLVRSEGRHTRDHGLFEVGQFLREILRDCGRRLFSAARRVSAFSNFIVCFWTGVQSFVLVGAADLFGLSVDFVPHWLHLAVGVSAGRIFHAAVLQLQFTQQLG